MIILTDLVDDISSQGIELTVVCMMCFRSHIVRRIVFLASLEEYGFSESVILKVLQVVLDLTVGCSVTAWSCDRPQQRHLQPKFEFDVQTSRPPPMISIGLFDHDLPCFFQINHSLCCLCQKHPIMNSGFT